MGKQITRRTFIVGAGSILALGYLSWERLVPGLLPGSGAASQADGGAAATGGAAAGQAPPPPTVECDYIFRQGLISDGSGSKAQPGDVGVKGKEIVAIGDFQAAPGAVTIDARGLIICPGFIDPHTHTEDYLSRGGGAAMQLLQGVTTHLGGNCGTSVDGVGAFLDGINKAGINLGLLAGYKNLRRAAVAKEGRAARPNEVAAMQEKLATMLQEGAFGLSVGLEYWPQTFATTGELVDLCQVLREKGGFYATHIRSESDRVLEAAAEAITIGQQAGVPVQYSHIKASFQRNWGKMQRILSLVDDARRGGLDITADVYGYTFSSWDLGSSRDSLSEDDLQLALQHPAVMIGSDSGLDAQGRAVHPRAYGNYPRILRRYALDKKVITLEQAIHKMTAMPAQRLGLKDRGLLAPGYKADIVAFDPEAIADRATRTNPNQTAAGVRWVLVNGQVAVKEGQVTGTMAGEVLRRN